VIRVALEIVFEEQTGESLPLRSNGEFGMLVVGQVVVDEISGREATCVPN